MRLLASDRQTASRRIGGKACSLGTRKAGIVSSILATVSPAIPFPLFALFIVCLRTARAFSPRMPPIAAALAKLALKDTTIASATVVPAASPVPEYCKVLGSITNLAAIHHRIRSALPTSKWNGKYFFAGGGGFNGTIPKLDQALAEGYAAAGSDTGHKGDSLDGQWALEQSASASKLRPSRHPRDHSDRQGNCPGFLRPTRSAAPISWAAPMAARWR